MVPDSGLSRPICVCKPQRLSCGSIMSAYLVPMYNTLPLLDGVTHQTISLDTPEPVSLFQFSIQAVDTTSTSVFFQNSEKSLV